MVITARNRAWLLIMRSYASCAFSSGNVSVMGRTPVIAEKFIVSSESIDGPEGHPWMPARFPIKPAVLSGIGVKSASSARRRSQGEGLGEESPNGRLCSSGAGASDVVGEGSIAVSFVHRILAE